MASGGIQANNHMQGDRSLSSQDVPQRPVSAMFSIFLLERAKGILWGAGMEDRIVGMGAQNGVTIFQRGFPVCIYKRRWNGIHILGEAHARKRNTRLRRHNTGSVTQSDCGMVQYGMFTARPSSFSETSRGRLQAASSRESVTSLCNI